MVVGAGAAAMGVDAGGAVPDVREIVAGSTDTGTSSSTIGFGTDVDVEVVDVDVEVDVEAVGFVVVVVVVVLGVTGTFSHHAIVVLAGSASAVGACGPASPRVTAR